MFSRGESYELGIVLANLDKSITSTLSVRREVGFNTKPAILFKCVTNYNVLCGFVMEATKLGFSSALVELTSTTIRIQKVSVFTGDILVVVNSTDVDLLERVSYNI